MNPYASYLGDRDARAVIAETAHRLGAAMQTLGTDGANRQPAPGKWSAREILCHLADCEIVFAFRLRQALAETDHVVQPFDQDKWAANYGAYDAPAAFAVFTTVRNWNVTLVQSLPAEAFTKKLSHPERGEMTFQTVLDTMAGHDLNHLAQVERMASSAAAAQ